MVDEYRGSRQRLFMYSGERSALEGKKLEELRR